MMRTSMYNRIRNNMYKVEETNVKRHRTRRFEIRVPRD